MTQRVRAAAAAAVISLLVAASFQRAQKTLCEGFLPPNTLSIPIGDAQATGISEAEFNEVLDRVEHIYAPIIAAHGGNLTVKRLWENGTVNASANQWGDQWLINMYGGLARHSAVTKDGFALVACHELGHHIGGFPKMGWATNEGGSDYYSTLKCLRRYFDASRRPAEVNPIAKESCERTFPEGPDRNVCMSGAMAGYSIASLFQALRPQPEPPAFDTPDQSVVDRINNAHPKGQCRLDTYFQAALCAKPLSEELSNDNEALGACTLAAGYTAGARPLCWYKSPSLDEGGDGGSPPGLAKRLKLPDSKTMQDQLDALKGALSSRRI